MRNVGIFGFCLLAVYGLTTSAQGQTSAVIPKAQVLRRAVLQNSNLTESSGVATSRSQPGVLWTFNDSGNPADVFATDTLGRDLGSFSHPDLRNIDWEAMSAAPCGAVQCLYIGDVGDNHEIRPEVQVYRWAEPNVPGHHENSPAPQQLRIHYPDHPHDVEAMFVTASGVVYLVSKGRSGGIGLYRIGVDAWNQGEQPVTAEWVQRLPIQAEEGFSQLVTDAALSPDGSSVVVRTYRYLYFYKLGADGHLAADPARPVCDVGGLEPQGEGVDWLDHERLVMTSEEVLNTGRTVLVITCRDR